MIAPRRFIYSPRTIRPPNRFAAAVTPRFRLINFLLCFASVPVLLYMLRSYEKKEKVLKLNFPCASTDFCPTTAPFIPDIIGTNLEDLNEHDAIMSVDLLNNWHWCPSALKRMRDLDGPVNEFLAKARSKNALVIHAVSDSKPHYLSEPGIIKAARTKAIERVPDGKGRDWGAISKAGLRLLNPPPPTSLSLDRTCGDAGRGLFGMRKPQGMRGLNETNLDSNYDIVAFDMDVIYSAIRHHHVPVRRVLFVGVHLDLCILYSRWFSILRMAAFWELDPAIHYGIVTNLVDASNSRPHEHFTTQMQRDAAAVDRLACWISCAAGPQVLQEKNRIALYDFRPG